MSVSVSAVCMSYRERERKTDATINDHNHNDDVLSNHLTVPFLVEKNAAAGCRYLVTTLRADLCFSTDACKRNMLLLLFLGIL